MPDYTESQRRAIANKWAWLDHEMSDGRPFVTGDHFTPADITGIMALKITDVVNEPVPSESSYAKAWEQRFRDRPSWSGLVSFQEGAWRTTKSWLTNSAKQSEMRTAYPKTA